MTVSPLPLPGAPKKMPGGYVVRDANDQAIGREQLHAFYQSRAYSRHPVSAAVEKFHPKLALLQPTAAFRDPRGVHCIKQDESSAERTAEWCGPDVRLQHRDTVLPCGFVVLLALASPMKMFPRGRNSDILHRAERAAIVSLM